MAKLNIYISKADQPVLDRLRRRLSKEQKNISGFFAEQARHYLGLPSQGPETLQREVAELRSRLDQLEQEAAR
jgi:hypothetical protein